MDAFNNYKVNVNLRSSAERDPDFGSILVYYAHGNHSYIQDGSTKAMVSVNKFHEQLSQSTIVSNNDKDGKGSVIVLHSCETGGGSESFAEQLSAIRQNSVIVAPSGKVFDDHSVAGKGSWNVFLNGTQITSVNGDNDSYMKLLKQLDHDMEGFVKKYAK